MKQNVALMTFISIHRRLSIQFPDAPFEGIGEFFDTLKEFHFPDDINSIELDLIELGHAYNVSLKDISEKINKSWASVAYIRQLVIELRHLRLFEKTITTQQEEKIKKVSNLNAFELEMLLDNIIKKFNVPREQALAIYHLIIK